jgi:hypothetical protein
MLPRILWPFLLAAAAAAQTPTADAVRREMDEERRAALVRRMARAPEALLSLLEQEPSGRVRLEIVDRLPLTAPGVREVLERHVRSDPDAAVAIRALERLRLLQAQANLALFEERLRQAAPAERTVLAAEHERAVAAARGARLPGFFHTPPPVFSVKPRGQSIRVLAFGDYGQGTAGQKAAAAAMLRYHREHPFDFGITLGDNFYPRGMQSPSDPRWKTLWEELYDPIAIPFYISFGNHDYGFPDSPAAELLYALKSPTWRLPATRYTFTAGDAQFFAIDSQAPSQAQWMWLDQELDRSTARWKIVYGHHPIYSHGQHGDTRQLISELLPVLRHRADAYFAGHEHDMQHLHPEDGVHLFISGGGGAGIRPITPGPRSLFAASSYGFSAIEADASSLKVGFYDTDLKLLYEHTLQK